MPALWAAEPGDEPADGPELAALNDPPSLLLGPDDLIILDDRLWTEAVTGVPQRVSTAPAPVEVITVDDLRLQPFSGIADRLRYVPGVDVYQGRHSLWDVGLRGYNTLNNPRIIIQVDGRDHGFQETDAQWWNGFLHRSDLVRVELVKGPASVTYGADAVGGVITMKGREVGDRPEIHVHSEAGNNGRRDLDATALVPITLKDGWPTLTIKASGGATQAKDLPATEGLSEVILAYPRVRNTGDDDLRTTRAQAIIGLRFDNDIKVEGEYYLLHQREWALLDPWTGYSDWGTVEQHSLGFRIRAPWGEIRHVHQHQHTDWSSEISFYTPFIDYYYNLVGFENDQDTTTVRLNHQFGDHLITVGGEYRFWRSESNIWTREGYALDRGSWGRVNSRRWGVYVQDQWRFAEDWTLTGALRFDDDNRVGRNWSPRLAVNWTIDERQFARLSYSSGYRLPSLIESYIEHYFFDSNADLKAEQVDAVELGWKGRFLEETLQLGANVSASRTNNLIVFVPFSPVVQQDNFNRWLQVPPYGPGPFPSPNVFRHPGPFFGYENQDNPLTILGAEIEGSWSTMDDRLTFWANATWQYSRYDQDIIYYSPGFYDPYFYQGQAFTFYTDLGDDINTAPDWKVNAGVTWDDGRWGFGVWGRYVSGREVFSQGSTYWATRTSLAVQDIPGYAALDIFASFREDFGFGELLVKVGVSDVFDSQHQEQFERSAEDLFIDWAKEYSAPVGRTYNLVLTWDW
jgi:outer membrane receptor protein involved in Fe transport